MTLKEWLEMSGTKSAELARRLGKPDTDVYRYKEGLHLPRHSVMMQIVELTGGLVTPADFHAAYRPKAAKAKQAN